MRLLISLLLGALSGFIAGKIMNSKGGFLRNMILGLVGSVVGSLVLGLIGFSGHGLIGNTIVSVVGACLLIAGGNAIAKK
ncbi:MAG: GlsB/YeaQ/YmgE family stress response membrane protein [Clostridium sp.]|nr:GlsB/YeaQ/YmgE family stress response membrane protein [Clostridium sp.]